MGGNASKSKKQANKAENSLRLRIRRIIEEETPDEDMGDFKFIGLEHVFGQTPEPGDDKPNKTKICLRILWFILIVVCVVTCVYQIWDRVDYYYTYPTALSVNVEQRQNISYPTITLCVDPNYNKAEKEKLGNLTGKHACDVMDLDLINRNFTRRKINARGMWRAKLQTKGVIFRVDSGTLAVRFNIPTVELQGASDPEFNTPFGNCLQSKTVAPSVKYQGTLTALVYGMKDARDKCNLPQVIVGGHKHYIDANAARPFPIGMLVALPLKRQDFQGLSTPVNPCVSEEEYWACLLPCYDKFFADNMPCSMPYVFNATKPDCETPEEAKAAHNLALTYMNKKFLDDNCGCTKPCNKSTYVLRMETIAKYPPLLIIYFPTSFVEVSTEIPAYEFEKLISDIGGNLGLFLGFCILSLMDSLQLFVDLLLDKIRPKRSAVAPKTQPMPARSRPNMLSNGQSKTYPPAAIHQRQPNYIIKR